MSENLTAEKRSSPVVWIALGLLLMVAIVAWGVTAWRAPEAAVAAGGSGEAMPAFDLVGARRPAASGRAAFEGRVVLYDFWATWCGPCHLQSDILRSIYAEARGRGAEFVGVATGEPAEVVREFLAPAPAALSGAARSREPARERARRSTACRPWWSSTAAAASPIGTPVSSTPTRCAGCWPAAESS